MAMILLMNQRDQKSNVVCNREDWLRAWLCSRRFQNARPVVREYQALIAQAYASAFGVDLSRSPKTERADWDVAMQHQVFMGFVEVRESTRSPFAGMMAAPRDIVELYRRHRDAVDDTLNAFLSAQDQLLLDLMKLIWGIDETWTVTQEDLHKAGHPREAPEDDWDIW